MIEPVLMLIGSFYIDEIKLAALPAIKQELENTEPRSDASKRSYRREIDVLAKQFHFAPEFFSYRVCKRPGNGGGCQK